MKGLILAVLLAASLIVAAVFIFSPDVKLSSLSENTNQQAISEQKVLSDIEQMDVQFSAEKEQLRNLVKDVAEIREKAVSKSDAVIANESGNEITIPTPEDKAIFNAKLKAAYEKAGLDYEAENQRILNEFDQASSDPETLNQ